MAGHIEHGMHRVAGARMVERKGEQRTRRQAGAGAAEPDACRGQLAQIAAANGTTAPAVSWPVTRRYSAGTDASRKRNE